jgi:hypothetical protein
MKQKSESIPRPKWHYRASLSDYQPDEGNSRRVLAEVYLSDESSQGWPFHSNDFAQMSQLPPMLVQYKAAKGKTAEAVSWYKSPLCTLHEPSLEIKPGVKPGGRTSSCRTENVHRTCSDGTLEVNFRTTGQVRR